MLKEPHSVKVPKFYKVASKILQLVQEKGASLKGLIFEKQERRVPRHPNTKGIYALVVSSIQNESVLGRLLRESKILVKEEKLDPWLARVLIVELLWGKRRLPPSTAKPMVTVLEYEQTFLGILREDVKSGTHENQPYQNKAEVKPRYVRVNTLLMSVGEAIVAFRYEGWKRATVPTDDYPAFLLKLAALENDEFLQDFHIKQLFAFPPRTEFFEHELYKNGSLILQDKATCLAPFILNPTPGSAVLDMCAAPGIKTTQLAAIMENKGTLYAVERHAARYKTLCEFIPRHGVTCATTIHADATSITPLECEKVEYILIDPSCSGSGMTRPTSVKGGDMDMERLRHLSAFQVILLERALTKFPSVKRVVYSTCSIYPEENEEVVGKVLDIVNADRQRFKMADNPLPSWPGRGSDKYKVGPHCLFADPDKDLTTGFFIAVFERVDLGDALDGNKAEIGVEISGGDNKKKAKKRKTRIKGEIAENERDCTTKVTKQDFENIDDYSNFKTKKKKKTEVVDDQNEIVDEDSCILKTKKHNHKKKEKNGKLETEVGNEAVGSGNNNVIETGVKRKKRRKLEIDESENVELNDEQDDNEGELGEGKKKKKKKKKKEKRKRETNAASEGGEEGELEWKKQKTENEPSGNGDNLMDTDGHEEFCEGKKKKKKHKREKQETER